MSAEDVMPAREPAPPANLLEIYAEGVRQSVLEVLGPDHPDPDAILAVIERNGGFDADWAGLRAVWDAAMRAAPGMGAAAIDEEVGPDAGSEE